MNETSLSIEQLKQYFEDRRFSPPILNISELEHHTLDDIAIIQSFYGQDSSRIAATANALREMIQATAHSSEWIFVEGQKSEKECCFRWLEKYGIKHIFVRTSSRQDGIFLKTPLWNIGAQNSTSSRLCFVDSDVSFCNSGWLDDVCQKFDSGFQAISPHGYSYYENTNDISTIDESIGHSIENGNPVSHYGFSIAMSRKVFQQINGFKASYILDDLAYWTSIVGDSAIQKIVNEWKIDDVQQYGIDVNVGSTEQTICHYYHGDREDRKYRQLVDICFRRTQSMDDIIVYDSTKPEILPEWNSKTSIGRIAHSAVMKCKNSTNKEKTGDDWYFDEVEEEFGKIDEKNPLVVVTCLSRICYKRNLKAILEFKDRIEKQIVDVSGFVCFSNVKHSEDSNVDIVPFKKDLEYGKDDFLQIFRKDVKFPIDSNILYIPFDVDVQISRICQCENDSIAFSKNGIAYFKYTKDNIQNIRRHHMLSKVEKIEKYLKIH